MRIDNLYAAFILIEILYEKGLVNEATYNKVKKFQKLQCDVGDLHISHIA